MRNYDMDVFNFESSYEVAEESLALLKKCEELFSLVVTSVASMKERFGEKFSSNPEIKKIIDLYTESMMLTRDELRELNKNHENFLIMAENWLEIPLVTHQSPDLSDCPIFEHFFLKKELSSEQYISNINQASKIFADKSSEIIKSTNDLSFIWKDSNYNIFAETIEESTKQLRKDYDTFATAIKDYINENGVAPVPEQFKTKN